MLLVVYSGRRLACKLAARFVDIDAVVDVCGGQGG
jgi:hypothetical protein